MNDGATGSDGVPQDSRSHRGATTIMSDHERGGVLECGECRVGLSWDPGIEVYRCPSCGWVKE